MLRRYNEFFKSLMRLSDLLFVSIAWWLAYWLRFHRGLVSATEDYIFRHYVLAWLIILVVWAAIFEILDFYRPRRLSTHWREVLDLIKASGLALLIFLGILFLAREIILSRAVVIVFWTGSLFFLNLSHILMREGLRFVRRRGYNLRHMAIVGTIGQAERIMATLSQHRHLGHRVVAFHPLDDKAPEQLSVNVKVVADLDRFLSV
ncbi:MAG TPA: hypothetical protein VFY83_09290, partial [Anaerolineales bacterium]|nr:hypothetical protein [Anaerolineales bacterium]